MAEALAVVGLVGSIVQFLDFSAKIIKRLNEIQSSAEDAPRAFQSVSTQLRLLCSNLERTQKKANNGELDASTVEGVKAVVDDCLSHVTRLNKILAKVDPGDSASFLRRGYKIWLSVHQEDEVKEITQSINNYVLHLIHHEQLNLQAALPVRPSPRRTPSFSTVPFPRDPNFAGRENQLNQISNLLQPGSRAALFGLGGIGKSQIAIEYSHKFQEMDPGAVVLWIYASSIARVDEAYKEIARRAQLPGHEDPAVSKLELVSNWLKEDASTSWLIVLDNADTEDTFFKPINTVAGSSSRKSLADLIPSAPNGRALITSRNRAVATKLAHRTRIIEVPNLTEDEGRKVLENAIGKDKIEDEDEVRKLLRTLEYLPLAISQAAAFIDEYDVSIAEYLEILDRGDQSLIKALSDDIEDSRRDRESLNSVIASWKLSFDYLRAQKPRAAELLSLMSMLDCKSIPERLMISQQLKDVEYIKAIGALKSFSLVTENSNKKEYTVHRLVHLATRTWIEKDGDAERWHKEALEAVNRIYPAGEVEQWKECSELEPHTEAVIVTESNDRDYQAQMASLLLRSARNSYHQYQFDTALERANKALKIRRGLCGEQGGDIQVAQCLQLLSWCHFGKKDHRRAIALAEETLLIYERHAGSDAEATMRARSNLSKFLTKNGNLDRAYEMQVAILASQREKLDENHSDILFTMNRLVNTLLKLKRYDEALKYSEALVAARRKASGETHSATLSAMFNYGTLLYDMGRTEDALAEMRTVYQGQTSVFDAERKEVQETLGLIQQYEQEVNARAKEMPSAVVVTEVQPV